MALFIYFIAFLEGFTTLSIEIIALRKFVPIVGSNSISNSIILGVILLALSYGYYVGGKISHKKDTKSLSSSIIKNLTIAAAYYLFFSFIIDVYLIEILLEYSKNYFFSIFFASILLFFIPVFFASQTIPLLSELLEGESAGEKIGKLLFYSTIGSFLGSIATSGILFPLLGVDKTATLNSVFLSGLAVLVAFLFVKKYTKIHLCSIALLIFSLGLIVTPSLLPKQLIYQKANSYHNIKIVDTTDKRLFLLNDGYSSAINLSNSQSTFGYIKEIKSQILSKNYKNILIIGAAGFTLPHELSASENIDSIDVVDVDPELQTISETYFLKQKLDEKITFIPSPARFFIRQSIAQQKQYDAIVIDVYIGKSLPAQTLTYEFFQQLSLLEGDIYINIITDSKLETKFSKSLFSTMHQAFGNLSYKNTNSFYNFQTNFVVTNTSIPEYQTYTPDPASEIYYDDKHSIELDLFLKERREFEQ